MVEAIAVPSAAEMLRMQQEFGTTVTTLYVLLAFGLVAVAVFIFLFRIKLDTLSQDMKEHRAASVTQSTNVNLLITSLQSFRDSEKDILNNIKESMVVHFESCKMGQNRITEVTNVASGHGKLLEKMLYQSESNGEVLSDVQKDTTSIGNTLDKLMAVLTTERRKDNDPGGQGQTFSEDGQSFGRPRKK
jgi:hypothetical protein